MRRISRASLGLGVVVLLVGVFMLASAAPAFAFTGPVRVTVYFTRALPATMTNGFQLVAREETSPNGITWSAPFAPVVKTFPYNWLPKSSLWLQLFPSALPHTARGFIGLNYPGNGRIIHFGESWAPLSPFYSPPTTTSGTFQATYKLPGWSWKMLIFKSWFSQSNGTATYRIPGSGAIIPAPMIWASQPRLYNPAEVPDDNDNMVANTSTLVVTNIKFAQGYGGGEALSLDDPQVAMAFATSTDATRSGPILVTPGGTVDLSAMPATIVDPDAGGSILMKGEVQDQLGNPVPFIVQFSPDSDSVVSTPSSSWWSLSALAVLALGVVFLNRKRLSHAA